MNKRFFTLMAAVLLAGAPLCNEAFAVNKTPVTATSSTSLANGLKFVLSDGSNYYKVTQTTIGGKKYVYLETSASETSLNNAPVFEIKSYANKTFQLWTGGKQVVESSSSASGTFYATKSGSIYEKADFDGIKVLKIGGTDVSLTTTPQAKFINAAYDAADLNANLSNKGFKLSFPGLTVAPDVNLFGNQLVAINATNISTLDATFSATGLMFALADEAGLKLMNDVTNKENWKAATFVVVNPNKNFGITGLDASVGEGFDFTTIKGSKLADDNSKDDGEIFYQNGVYTVADADVLNAEDELTLNIAAANVVKGTDQNHPVTNLKVGVYALTTGGLKSYVTTATTNAGKLVKASTAGNTYVAAADLLKAEAPAVYNIFFPGKAASGETSSYKGKYLVAENAADTAAVAPAYVATGHISAQWVVTDVQSKGQVVLTNMGNKKTVSLKLYKTDNAGEYQATGFDASAIGTEVVKLIPATENGSFLNLTDAQKKQAAKISFNGVGNVTVKEIYMGVDRNLDVYPTSNEIANTAWYLDDEDIAPIEYVNTYAYLKGSEVKTDGADTLKVQPYYLTYADDPAYTFAWDAVGSKVVISNTIIPNLPYVFQQNANGTYTMWNVVTPTSPIALYVNTQAVSGAEFGGAAVGAVPAQYSTVSMEFKTLGESLEAVARHAALEAENGGVSMQLNANGIVEGIIAGEPLTFWLDTADTDADVPSFYISKGIPADDEEEVATKAADVAARMFLYSPADSAYYWDANKATYVTDYNYYMPYSTDLKAVFRPAALVGVDTLATIKGDDAVLVSKKAKAGVCEAGIEGYKFNIVKPEGADAYYVVDADGNYLFNLNGVLGFTADDRKALPITIGEGDPTANEAIAAEAGVQVIGGQGVVTVQGAAGKVVTVANILGQTIANQVAASDNVTIAVPAGIVVVSVDGEATKVIVK